jgi:hypothetical protein
MPLAYTRLRAQVLVAPGPGSEISWKGSATTGTRYATSRRLTVKPPDPARDKKSRQAREIHEQGEGTRGMALFVHLPE